MPWGLPNITQTGTVRAMAKLLGPTVVRERIAEMFRDKDTKGFYEIINKTIWESITPQEQNFLLSMRPWQELDWLTFENIVEAISLYNKKLLPLIYSSLDIQSRLKEQIEDMKARLS